jgi:hypothetical protein
MMAFSETADVIFMLCGKEGQGINDTRRGISNAPVPSIDDPSTGMPVSGLRQHCVHQRALKRCMMTPLDVCTQITPL